MAIKTRPRPNTLDQHISGSPYFQRAVHLRYDLRSLEAVARYVPTLNAATAVGAILRGVNSDATQRSHVLHAAYGSGKSLLAVSLAALLEKQEHTLPAVEQFVSRLQGVHPESGKLAEEYLASPVRLLPVVLVGDEGDFADALSRGLARALADASLDLQPNTRYEAALSIIKLWETTYPDTLTQLEELLISEQSGQSLDGFREALAKQNSDAIKDFEQLYTLLTAGATFDQFYGQTPDIIYRDIAALLPNHGYDGIVVLWDEFGRFLESRTTKVFSDEAALLQNFAETCNYSGEQQIHFFLFAHKELQSYASALPKSYQQEWSRIEGRFQRHHVFSDPLIAYSLIASAITYADEKLVHELQPDSQVNDFLNHSLEAHLFGVLNPEEIRRLIHRTWPLHPLTVFALAHLSNRVAQNERTMFTFLTTEEPHALQILLRSVQVGDEDLLVRPEVLWDYFEEAVRSDTGVGGAHRIWSGVIHALDKVQPGDLLSHSLVKALGVILASSEAGGTRPTTDLLAWAVGAQTEESRGAVAQALENLRRRKAIIHRQIDGYWTFTSGSDIDFEQQLEEALERTNPNWLQLRRLLESVIPAPYTLARGYNQTHAMTRYFTGVYRWPQELVEAPWDLHIKQTGNADGLVVYVLAHDDLSTEEARQALQAHERIIYVLPDEPLLSLVDRLRELFGLHELNNEPSLKQQEDRERIQREIDWLIEDAQARLHREIVALVEPRQGKSDWIASDSTGLRSHPIQNPGQATRLVSSICGQIFPDTPTFNNEGLNKRRPTPQQTRAAETVIDAMFTREPAHQLGLEGRGPEVLACNTLLVKPGILREENGEWIIGRPLNGNSLGIIWDLTEAYLDECQIDGGQPIEPLLEELAAPPYGLRWGVIPTLFAAVIRGRLKATTIRKDGRPVFPISGALVNNVVVKPEHFTIEVGEWSETLERLWQGLVSRFGSHIHETEQSQEPLSMMKTAMVRWLQALPSFCRDTRQISEEASRFRDLIRQAQVDPAGVVLRGLPELLALDDTLTQLEIEERLEILMSEISNAYLELQRRLDLFAINEFVQPNGHQGRDGAGTLRAWLDYVQISHNSEMTELRFGSPTTQAFVDRVLSGQDDDSLFWDQLSVAVTGLHLRDWTDHSEESFRQILLNARAEIEIETEELLDGKAVVSISAHLPDEGQRDYRFRAASLSEQAKRLLQNFISTLDVAGRPLSVDEKRQVAVNFLRYVMGDDIDD